MILIIDFTKLPLYICVYQNRKEMKAVELIKKMKEAGMDEAASIIEKRIEKHPETNSIYVSDFDDQAYNSGLAGFLQNNTKWFNCPDRNGFKAIFN